MIIINITLIIILFCSSVYFTITDIRENRISNKIVALTTFSGAVLSVMMYIIIQKELLIVYGLNVLVTVLISLTLYFLHVWAAGDSKMYICMAVLTPVSFLQYKDKIIFTGIFYAAAAFAVGFIYLAIDTACLYITHKIEFNKTSFITQFKSFIKRYLKNVIIITGMLAVEEAFTEKTEIQMQMYFLIPFNFIIMLLISFLKEKIRTILTFVFGMASLIVFFMFDILAVRRASIRYYLVIIVFMMFRILINEGNYEIISSSEVKEGMILSTITTLMMSNSRIPGLPRLSKENMADRLTSSEAEAVRKWGNIKGVPLQVQIVKKVPFALFLTIGMFINVIVWGIAHFAN